MLVLSRKLGETIVIDDVIQVTIVDIKGDKVRLGVSAPDSVRIDRLEVHHRRSEFTDPLAETQVGSG